jgi:hypothetical protein
MHFSKSGGLSGPTRISTHQKSPAIPGLFNLSKTPEILLMSYFSIFFSSFSRKIRFHS